MDELFASEWNMSDGTTENVQTFRNSFAKVSLHSPALQHEMFRACNRTVNTLELLRDSHGGLSHGTTPTAGGESRHHCKRRFLVLRRGFCTTPARMCHAQKHQKNPSIRPLHGLRMFITRKSTISDMSSQRSFHKARRHAQKSAFFTAFMNFWLGPSFVTYEDNVCE